MDIVVDMPETKSSHPHYIGDRVYWIFIKLEPITLHRKQKCSKCSNPAEGRTIHRVTKVYYEIQELSEHSPEKLLSVIPISSDLGRELLRKTQVYYQKLFCNKCL